MMVAVIIQAEGIINNLGLSAVIFTKSHRGGE